MIMILCLVKLLSCFPTLFYCCCGDRIVLGIARIMFLVTYVYLRCLASLHSCGVLARYPFTCNSAAVFAVFTAACTVHVRAVGEGRGGKTGYL